MNQPLSNTLEIEGVRNIISHIVSAGRLPNCVTFLDRFFRQLEELPTETLAAHKDIGYLLNVRWHCIKKMYELNRTYPQYLESMTANHDRKLATEILENCFDQVANSFSLEALLAAYYLENRERFIVPNGLRTRQERLNADRMARAANHPAVYREPSSVFPIQFGLVTQEYVDFVLEQSASEFPLLICGTDEIRALIFAGYYEEVKTVAKNYLTQPDSIFNDTNPAEYFKALSGRERGPNTLQGFRDFEEKYRLLDDETCELLQKKFINGFLAREVLTDDPHFRVKFCMLRDADVELFNSKAVPKLYKELFGENMFVRASNVPVSYFVDPDRNLSSHEDGLRLVSLV